jgi:transposase
MSAAKDGVKRRSWSFVERQRIVAEALAPGASVAAVARRHGLNANLIFKWLRRSREGWLDRRRAAAARMSPELAAQTFVPVELLELKPAPVSPALAPSSLPVAKMAASPARGARKSVRRHGSQPAEWRALVPRRRRGHGRSAPRVVCAG